MCERIKIAEQAQIVVNGYAFIEENSIVKVRNLNQLDKVAIIDGQDEVIETTMDDIELDIVMGYLSKNRKYMEV